MSEYLSKKNIEREEVQEKKKEHLTEYFNTRKDKIQRDKDGNIIPKIKLSKKNPIKKSKNKKDNNEKTEEESENQKEEIVNDYQKKTSAQLKKSLES